MAAVSGWGPDHWWRLPPPAAASVSPARRAGGEGRVASLRASALWQVRVIPAFACGSESVGPRHQERVFLIHQKNQVHLKFRALEKYLRNYRFLVSKASEDAMPFSAKGHPFHCGKTMGRFPPPTPEMQYGKTVTQKQPFAWVVISAARCGKYRSMWVFVPGFRPCTFSRFIFQLSWNLLTPPLSVALLRQGGALGKPRSEAPQGVRGCDSSVLGPDSLDRSARRRRAVWPQQQYGLTLKFPGGFCLPA